jgi:putative NADH-flavin reductase
MKVLVIGANGKTGFLITQKLANTRHTPFAMIRNANQKSRFDSLGAQCTIGNLEYPIDEQVNGCDAVVFAAGSGSKTGKDKTVLIDHIGGIKSAVTAAVMGAKRFIMLSSLNADTKSQSRIRHYHRAKGHADNFIREINQVMDQSLDWTIVCPGRLTDEPGSGCVEITTSIHGEGSTSRDNVAQTIVDCLDASNTIGKTFSLLDGEVPIKEALSKI